MSATTVAEVRAAFGRAQRAATAAGIDSSGWRLQEGSQTYGRAWRIFDMAPAGGLATVAGVSDFLGLTRREAACSLRGLAQGLELSVR